MKSTSADDHKQMIQSLLSELTTEISDHKNQGHHRRNARSVMSRDHFKGLLRDLDELLRSHQAALLEECSVALVPDEDSHDELSSNEVEVKGLSDVCLLYTSPSPRD